MTEKCWFGTVWRSGGRRIQTPADSSQCLVKNLDLLTTSFVGRLGSAASTFGLNPGGTLPP